MDLQHGDVLVCYGRSKTSWLIRLWTGIHRPWLYTRNRFHSPSHIAFVCNDFMDRPVIFESTSLSSMPDLYRSRPSVGVQAHKPDDWIRQYPGQVDLFRLKIQPLRNRKEFSLMYVMLKHTSQTEYDVLGAAGAGIDIVRNTEDGSKLFCSEFCAFFLQKLGALSNSVNCSEVTPLDVTGFKCIEFKRKLK